MGIFSQLKKRENKYLYFKIRNFAKLANHGRTYQEHKWKKNNIPALALFDKGAKLGKAWRDTYIRGGWLILQDLLKSGLLEALTVASKVHDFIEDYLGYTFKIFWIIYQFVVDVVKIGVQLPFEFSECRSECVENL